MTLAFKKISTGHQRTPFACLSCLLFLAMPVLCSAQASPASRTDLVKIALKDDYSLMLRFRAYPRYAFDLWLPELAIFDSDLDRSQEAQPIEGVWLGKWQGNLQVEGRLTTGNKGMDFLCTLKPLSGDALMLDLEVLNSGHADWNDYAQLAVCLAPSEGNHAFSDKTGDRSYVSSQHAGIQRITKAGVVGDFNHYAVEGHSDPADSIQRARVKDGFVARQSADGRLTLSFMWDDAARVDVNPGGLDCIHSDPAAGPLKAGETKILHGYIMIGKGTVEDRYTAMKNLIKDHPTK
jgi:hypothetical protein